MKNPSYKKSPIDELFKELYGYYPPKAGQAFEMMVSASLKLLLNKDVSYNQFKRGNYSDTVYQLDGFLEDEKNPVEAKDYTIDERKVGRGDLQKLQGALNDLDAQKALFASATDYTKPAKKYSNSQIPNNVPIELLHIRPVIEKDREGRIEKIIIKMQAHWPNYEKANLIFVWTKESAQKLREQGYDKKQMKLMLKEFYDCEGNVMETIANLTKNYPPGTTFERNFISKGCWIIRGGHLKLDNSLFEFVGIEYSVPYISTNDEIIIDVDGTPKIYIKSENGEIDKLLTDQDLKKIQFKDGKVSLNK